MTNQESPVEGIAIIGMAGRFPQAETIEQFWANLRDGVESVSVFSDEELAGAGVGPELLGHPQYIKARAALEDIDLFDAAFFGFTPREAEIMDPQHRLFLECAWHALEDAGYNPETYDGAIGVFAGTQLSSYLLANLYPNRDYLESVGPLAVRLGNDKDFLPTRASYKFNLRGPSMSIQTACSSSLVASHVACQSLLDYQCDMALVGGVSITTPQKNGYLYEEGGIYSPDGHCRVFDAKARGTIAGSGLGLVVLKRAADALADGDTIYAIIKGSAINNDGSLKVGYTAPSVDGQAEVIAAAYAVADIDPASVGYIEAHGTGTSLGDPVEIAALTQVFRESSDRNGFCAVGSVKSNIGHLDAGAGVAGLIKAALALHHRQIPPSLNCDEPNPAINFPQTPFFVNTSLRPWTAGAAPRRAGVSSFAVGGTNVHVVLEEAPPPPPPGPSRSQHALLLSAKTEAALDRQARRLAAHLRQNPGLDIADVAYTLHVGRKAFPLRRAIVCGDAADAADMLEGHDPARVADGRGSEAPRPVAFMFPGQGAQYATMARGLYETEESFRATLDRCAELLRPHLGLDLRAVLFPAAQQAAVAAQQLEQTMIAQPALFAVEYALARLWMQWGVKPQAMIGHSIGEYVAACLAGVFSLEDGLALVAARGRLMQKLPGGSMLAVPLPEQVLAHWLGPNVALAATNGPAMSVLSGQAGAIGAVQEQLAAQGIECRRLHTSHAFHSAMMEPMLRAFAEQVRRVRLSPPQIPYVSNVTGGWITAAEALDPEYWTRHIRQTVRFAEGLATLAEKVNGALLEVGPGRTLSTLARQQPALPADAAILTSLRHPQEQRSDLGFLLQSLGKLWAAGGAIDWAGYYAGERRRRVPLPAYPYDRQRYWIDAPAAGQAGRRPAVLGKAPDVADWFYAPAWQESAPPKPLEALLSAERPGGWLVFADGAPLGQALVQRLKRLGQEVVAVRRGAGFERIDSAEYAAAPDAPGLARLLDALAADGHAPERIVYLWSLADDRAAAPLPWAPDGGAALEWLAQAFGHAALGGLRRLAAILSQSCDVAGTEALELEQAAIAGLGGIARRHPQIEVALIDVAAPRSRSAQERRLVDLLLAECLAPSADPPVAYRGTRRWTRAWNRARPAEGAESRLRDRGVYLLTDGLAEPGLRIAEHLARSVRARLILAGPALLPERAEWAGRMAGHDGGGAPDRMLQALQALEALGAEILPIQADLAQPGAIEDLLRQAEARFGALDGIIYGARPDAAESVDGRSLRAHAENLAALGAIDRPLDFVLVHSPLAFDGAPNAAATDSLLDAAVQQQNQRSPTPWQRVRWDDWGESTEYAIAPAEGAKVLERVFAQDAPPHLLVSTGDLHVRQARGGAAEPGDQAAEPRLGSQQTRPALQTAYVEPATPTERRLATVWQELLGIGEIGAHDNFFELGGHSLLATQVLSRIRDAFQTTLALSDFFEQPSVAAVAGRIDGLAAQQPAADSRIVAVSRDQRLPLSFAQQRLWFLHQLDPASPSYNMPFAVRIAGRLDRAALARSLNELVRRHETLRTIFMAEDGKSYQVILPDLPVDLPLISLESADGADEQSAALRQLANQQARHPFDLQRGPLLRASLARLGAEDHAIVLVMHHIVADGWSLGVLVQELAALYEAASSGLPAALPALPIQYADFAAWQRKHLLGEVLDDHLAYWKRQLGGALPRLQLPLARQQPSRAAARVARRTLALSQATLGALAALSEREGVTLFMTLLAAFQTLLHHHTGQRDMVLGTDVANRNRIETEGLIGFFVNQLVLRTDLSGDPPFRELLKRVRAVTLAAYDHQDLPFDRVVEAVNPERGPELPPFFQVKIVLQNTPMTTLELREINLIPLAVEPETAKFDLLVNIVDTGRELAVTWEYNTDIFEAAAIARLAAGYELLLAAIAEQPAGTLLELGRLVADAERQQQLKKDQEFKEARLQKFKKLAKPTLNQ